eukprot:365939-Chlamydomonas_euryale.AAC.15
MKTRPLQPRHEGPAQGGQTRCVCVGLIGWLGLVDEDAAVAATLRRTACRGQTVLGGSSVAAPPCRWPPCRRSP